jgi:hypothetical protein
MWIYKTIYTQHTQTKTHIHAQLQDICVYTSREFAFPVGYGGCWWGPCRCGIEDTSRFPYRYIYIYICTRADGSPESAGRFVFRANFCVIARINRKERRFRGQMRTVRGTQPRLESELSDKFRNKLGRSVCLEWREGLSNWK